MFNFFKNRNLSKFSILLIIAGLVYFAFFLTKNINFRNFAKTTDIISLSQSKETFSNFFTINKIEMVGRSKTNISLIEKIILPSTNENKNLMNYDFKKTKVLLEKLPWIDKVSIKRQFPNNITIYIKEHKPFAILINKKKNFLISNNGKIIYEVSNPEAYNIIRLEGYQVINNIKDIGDFLDQHSSLKKQITKINILQNNRWDLVLNNKILFKLPSKNKGDAMNHISKYISLKNVEVVDLRFLEKKIYIKIKKNKYALSKEKK